MSAMSDRTLLLNALADGELDAARALDLERQLAGDADLRREFEAILALRSALHDRIVPEQTSAAFRAKVAALAAAPRLAEATPALPSWRMLAAASVFAALLASGATWLALAPAPSGSVAQAVLSGHIRSLAAGKPFDVASSDRHTVKPWFNGRISAAPQVADLSGKGFALAGGRIDVVGTQTVPTLVYNFNAHVISLTIVPQSPGAAAQTLHRLSISGFSLVSWTAGGFSHWAVSDTSFDELENFAALYREAAQL